MIAKFICGLGVSILGYKIFKSSELNQEFSSVFSSASVSIPEAIEIVQKFSSSSLESPSIQSFAVDIASSIHRENVSALPLKSLAIAAFGTILSGVGIHRYLTRNKEPHSKHRKFTSQGSRSTKDRGFLNRSANHCFANALLVCLIYLPGFKEKICCSAASKNSSNLVLRSLAALFLAINQNRERLDAAIVEAHKGDFCHEIAKSSPEIQVFYEKGGDSRSLFQILCENLPSDLQYFSFTQEKIVTCENCLNQGRQIIPKRFVENPSMLDIQEDSYFKNNYYFPPQTELRTCKACGPRAPHQKQVALSSFPEILAIRIGDTPGFKKEQVDPWLEIFFGKTEGGKQGYRFVGGVYNTNKGYDGAHSVAYVYKEDRSFWCYNDTDVKRVNREEIKGYPKLMFYVKDLSEQVVLDVVEGWLSEESMDENLKEESNEVDFFV